jgi:DNA-3-methyladenine glycosylase
VELVILMIKAYRLERSFFNCHSTQVARELLGTRLVRIENDQRLSGLIIETEAYSGEEDQGCHAKVGLTPRTRVMYGPPGYTYVYFTYGMHWMLNFVSEPEGRPAAVLIRAILPLEGQVVMGSRRGEQPRKHWTDGPAKLCHALNIDGRCNRLDLCNPQADIFVEYGEAIPDAFVNTSPRVGLNRVIEPWKSIPWRYYVSEYEELTPLSLQNNSFYTKEPRI